MKTKIFYLMIKNKCVACTEFTCLFLFGFTQSFSIHKMIDICFKASMPREKNCIFERSISFVSNIAKVICIQSFNLFSIFFTKKGSLTA